MMVLDLCAGLGGASQAMKERGWQVVTLDYDPRFGCDFTADVRDWHYPADLPTPDLIWASPPCDEFSREFMPWSKTGKKPDMSIVLACKRIIDEVQPRFWVIENTKGAISHFRPYFGNYRFCVGPFYLWGFFPAPGKVSQKGWRKKESFSSTASAERAVIPPSLSRAIAIGCESQVALHLPNTACTGLAVSTAKAGDTTPGNLSAYGKCVRCGGEFLYCPECQRQGKMSACLCEDCEKYTAQPALAGGRKARVRSGQSKSIGALRR